MMPAPAPELPQPIAGHVRATLVLAGPIVLSQVAQVSMGFVDTAMVGRLGATALAGIALGSSVFFTLAMVCLGIVIAAGPMVAQAVGAGDESGAARSVRQALWTAAGLGALGGLLLALAGPLLALMGQPPDVQALAAGYLRAIAWGLPAFLGFGALRAFAEGIERPIPVTVIALSAVGVNVVANLGFVFGRWGLPEMGAVGVGWASTTSFWYLFGAMALFVRFKPEFARFGIFRGLRRPDPPVLRELVSIGWPIGISFGIESGLFAVTAVMMGWIGATQLAAHQIALQLAAMTFMVALAVSLAGTVRVGQAVGRANAVDVRRAGWTAVALGTGFMLISATVFLTVPNALIALFLDTGDADNAAVVALAVHLLAIAGAFQLVDGLQVGAAGALRGLKDTRVPMLIGLATYWGVGLTAGYLLAFWAGMGAPGLWWGLVLGLASAALGLSLRFRRKTRRLEAVPAIESV
jgi:MATE family multidrug resistance protein